MAVAHESVTESHTGITASTSETFFDFSVPFTASSKGLLIFTMVLAAAVEGDDTATSVKIDPAGTNTDVPAVTGGRAVVGGENGDCKAWFRGGNLPTTTTTVRVNRVNDTNNVYAVAILVTASGNTEIYEAGIVLLEGDGTVAEQSVTDGSPGTNSLRYAGIFSGLAGIGSELQAGANSTEMVGIDIGTRVADTARETTAGQGSRPVGLVATVTDERAAVHLAVREVAAGGNQTLTGSSLYTKTPTFPTGVVSAAYSLAGSLFAKNPTFRRGVVSFVVGGTQFLDGALYQKTPTFPQGALSGGAVVVGGNMVVLSDLWVHLASDLDTFVQMYAGAIVDETTITGEVRRYANGVHRAITVPGTAREVRVDLPFLERDDLETLESWAGIPVMVRDPLGRKVFGVFFSLDTAEQPLGDVDTVLQSGFTLSALSLSEEI